MTNELSDGIRSLLTYGQLSLVRSLETLPSERWAETYLHDAVALPEGTELSAITAALRVVQERHESLRTHFVDPMPSDGITDELVAVTMPPGQPPIDLIELPGAGEDEATNTVRDRVRTRFRWNREPGWRATVVTDDGKPRYLVIVVDHLVADGWGLQIVTTELYALLCGDAEQIAREWSERPPQPRQLAAVQRSAASRAGHVASCGYWERLLRELPEDVFPWRTDPETGRIEAVLHSRQAPIALGRAAYRLGISPQSVMLALGGIAAACAYRQDIAVLTLVASNRYDRRWRDIVSSMTQATPLPVTVDRADESFESFAQRVHWDGLNAYRYGSYHFDEVAKKVRQMRGVDLQYDVFFNFMAHSLQAVDGQVTMAALPAATVTERLPRRQAGPRFDVKIADAEDMPVQIRADPTLLSQRRLNHMLYWVDDELGRLARGEPVALAQVRNRCEAPF